MAGSINLPPQLTGEGNVAARVNALFGNITHVPVAEAGVTKAFLEIDRRRFNITDEQVGAALTHANDDLTEALLQKGCTDIRMTRTEFHEAHGNTSLHVDLRGVDPREGHWKAFGKYRLADASSMLPKPKLDHLNADI